MCVLMGPACEAASIGVLASRRGRLDSGDAARSAGGARKVSPTANHTLSLEHNNGYDGEFPNAQPADKATVPSISAKCRAQAAVPLGNAVRDGEKRRRR